MTDSVSAVTSRGLEDLDPDTLEFLIRVWTDTAGFCTTVFAALGDRLGLWPALARTGWTTAEDLAAVTGLQPRYVTEWVNGMIAAGYLDADEASNMVRLAPGRVEVLAREAGPVFAGGVHQMLLGLVAVYPEIARCMVEGGGVPQSAYSQDVWTGLTRFSASAFENLLVQVWLPAVQPVERLLSGGCRVLDVGTGHGLAVRTMAAAYPQSTFVGADLFPNVINVANDAARREGLADRVEFVAADVLDLDLPPFDLITSFDVVHESDDPEAFVRSVRDLLVPGGYWLALEANCGETPLENAGPLGTMLYGYSLMFCLTTSLSRGGVGLGTCGLPGSRLGSMCEDAGLEVIHGVIPEHPYHLVHLARRPIDQAEVSDP